MEEEKRTGEKGREGGERRAEDKEKEDEKN